MDRLIVAIAIVMLLFVPAAATVNILPIGDSITANLKTKSYRYHLYQQLKGAGYDVNFVGTQRNQLADGFDPDHEGHSGWRADQIADSIDWWLKNYTTDIVLLHIGHNDIFQGKSLNSIVDDISRIIKNLRSNNPKVTILLAQIIYPNWTQTKWVELNKQILMLAEKVSTDQSPVVAVNHNELFVPQTDTYDNTHPNDSGDRKIAQQWYNALVKVLAPNSPKGYEVTLPNHIVAPTELKIISEKR